ncbi:MAG: UDP-N-acetylmuramoyl-L-alanine--D-glutamate ligase [Saprospiraceae bacterium]|nr:UDP-N-acetylmuramoyl-L-alanine--D-glutamate ligase [Saprospiraceae bacterium]
MKVVVLGSGESGTGAALLAASKGYAVWVSEAGEIGAANRDHLLAAGIPFEEGGHTLDRMRDAEVVIKSPGIPDRAPIVEALKSLGIPVIGEIEFAYRHLPEGAKIIGITGSNGKTTTTLLTYHLLLEAGVDVALGGNVGRSFAALLLERPYAWYVLELSSFQLDGIHTFRSDIGMLLNVSPDHLDRYDYQMDLYVASKFRVVLNMGTSGVCLFNGGDPVLQSFIQAGDWQHSWEAIGDDVSDGEDLHAGGATFRLRNPMLQGRHNRMNALFAIRAAQILGLSRDVIQRGLETFVNHPHRLEPIGTIDGISFINDSKATNTDAVGYALDAMKAPVVWIVGGQDKGNDYMPLLPLVREKVKAIICMGIDNRPILEAFGALGKPMEEVRSAAAAVEVAYRMASSGDVVLLSPACASFDLFKNYLDRGEQFRFAVKELAKRSGQV